MDSWLGNAPALAFVKDLSCWFVLNKKCEPFIWIDDERELAWFFASILELNVNEPTKLRVIKTDKRTTKTRSRRTQFERRSPGVALPIRP
jgi:hypothetical protein